MNKPKILVGCPTSDLYNYCFEDYVDAIKNLTYPNYNILFVDNSKTKDHFFRLKKLNLPVVRLIYNANIRPRLVNSRNKLRDVVLENNYDYLLMTDQDIILPKDVIEKLLVHNKKIISAVYFNWIVFNKKRIFTPILLISNNYKTRTARYMDEKEIEQYVHRNPGLMRVKGCGFGCVLIHKDILEKIRFGWESVTDDMDFCIAVWKNNFKIFADTSVICKHLVLKKPFTLKDLEKD